MCHHTHYDRKNEIKNYYQRFNYQYKTYVVPLRKLHGLKQKVRLQQHLSKTTTPFFKWRCSRKRAALYSVVNHCRKNINDVLVLYRKLQYTHMFIFSVT